MKSKVYRKVSSHLNDGLCVLLTSAFHGEAGKTDGDLKKIIHAKSNGCEYRQPVKFCGEDLITTYEPMAPPAIPESGIMTGLDLRIIDSLCREEEEIVVITIIDALAERHQGVKMYMLKDGTIKGRPEEDPIPGPVMDRISAEAKGLFGTGEYRFIILPMDKDGLSGYSVLLENME